ncbi:MAG: hypothetical protein COW08_05350 [Ignavibacteriales bacterium CG12_big_fil_rev_8_21_14_0_65_30_8]|nr:MAG: hypothetical protein COW08_05350 [Ignavibacteriales bacterium CG12_big_fil_rev_8_21_14_0_65_30_8]
MGLIEFYFFKIPGLYQVDVASGTFGYSMHGPLSFFQIIMIILVSKSNVDWVEKYRYIINIGLGISILFTFSGGGMLALMLVSPFLFRGSFKRVLGTVIGSMFIVLIIYFGSAIIAQKFGNTASNLNLMSYGYDQFIASINIFEKNNKYYENRSRGYAMRNAFSYVSHSPEKLLFGEGSGSLTSSFALDKESYLESKLFATKPVINTPSFFIVENGLVFLILISIYVYRMITYKHTINNQIILAIVFTAYYFYYNIFFHHQVLIALLIAHKILFEGNDERNEIHNYSAI